MELKVLGAIKAEVRLLNRCAFDEEFEVWFPHMFKDGCWACDVVFPNCARGEYLQRLFSLLYANDCHWFFMEVNGDVAIHIQ